MTEEILLYPFLDFNSLVNLDKYKPTRLPSGEYSSLETRAYAIVDVRISINPLVTDSPQLMGHAPSSDSPVPGDSPLLRQKPSTSSTPATLDPLEIVSTAVFDLF